MLTGLSGSNKLMYLRGASDNWEGGGRKPGASKGDIACVVSFLLASRLDANAAGDVDGRYAIHSEGQSQQNDTPADHDVSGRAVNGHRSCQFGAKNDAAPKRTCGLWIRPFQCPV